MAKKKECTQVTFQVTLTYKGPERKDRNKFSKWFQLRHGNLIEHKYGVPADDYYEVDELEIKKIEVEIPKKDQKKYKRSSTNSTIRDLLISACTKAGYEKSTHKEIKTSNEDKKLFHVTGDYSMAEWNNGIVDFTIYTHYGTTSSRYYPNSKDYLTQRVSINPETGKITASIGYYADANQFYARDWKEVNFEGNIANPDIEEKLSKFLAKVLPLGLEQRQARRKARSY